MITGTATAAGADSGNIAKTMQSVGSARIRTLLAENRSLLRIGLQKVLDEAPDISVIGEATSCDVAVDHVRTLEPDVIVVGSLDDCPEPAISSQKIAMSCSVQTPSFLILTEARNALPAGLTQSGATGVLLTDATPGQLTSAIRILSAGYSFFNEKLNNDIAAISRLTAPSQRAEDLQKMTARELDMLYLLARGSTNAEISQELGLGESTVKSHVQSLFNKLHLRNRVAAAIYAYESGLIRIGENDLSRIRGHLL